MKRIVILGVCICFLCLYGCDSEYNNEILSNDPTKTESSIVESWGDSIQVNVTPEVPDKFDGEAYIYSAKQRHFSEEEVINFFLGNSENVKEIYDNIFSVDNSILNLERGLTYISNNSSLFTMFFDEYNCPEMKELSFSSLSTAEEKIREFAKKMDINLVLLKAYSMDRTYISNMISEYTPDLQLGEPTQQQLRDQFNELGECYVFFFEQSLDDIPVAGITYVTKDDSVVDGGLVSAYLCASGIVQFNIDFAYQVEPNDHPITVVSPEQALKVVRNKFENIIITNNITINGMRLCYYPIITDSAKKTYNLVPAWDISYSYDVQEAVDEDILQKYQEVYGQHIYINAEDGSEIVI